MNLRPGLRTIGLVAAALALPVVLAAATWTMTGTSFGGTMVGVEEGRTEPATPATSTTARPTDVTRAPATTTGAGDDRCAEPEHADDDRCTGRDDRGASGSGSGSGGDGGRGRNRGRGGGGDD